MNKAIRAIGAVAAIIAIAGCGGKETIIKEVMVTQPVVESTSAPYSPDKYDLYLDQVYTYSAQARSWTESDLLELGTIVCDTFDNGATLQEVLEIFANNSTGSYDDELYAGILGSAVMFICPEHQAYVESQI